MGMERTSTSAAASAAAAAATAAAARSTRATESNNTDDVFYDANGGGGGNDGDDDVFHDALNSSGEDPSSGERKKSGWRRALAAAATTGLLALDATGVGNAPKFTPGEQKKMNLWSFGGGVEGGRKATTMARDLLSRNRQFSSSLQFRNRFDAGQKDVAEKAIQHRLSELHRSDFRNASTGMKSRPGNDGVSHHNVAPKFKGVLASVNLENRHVLSDMNRLLRQNNFTAQNDVYGISPGTHLATGFAPAFAPLGLLYAAHETIPGSVKEITFGNMCQMFHHVVYLGNGYTIGWPEGLDRLELKPEEQVFIVPHRSPLPTKEIVRRAIAFALSPKPIPEYSALMRNCEHFANLIVGDAMHSSQSVACLAIFVGTWAAIVRSKTATLKARARGLREVLRRWRSWPGQGQRR